jgi:flagellar basal-body rod protein FlgF
MDRLIYTSLSAMRALMDRQSITASNLANVNTTGFRGDLADTQAAYLGLNDGAVTGRAQTTQSVQRADMKAGSAISTGRDLDVAVNGDAMIAVQGPDGQEAYTRRGDFVLSDSGLLTTGDGFPVMGDGGPITLPPADKISINATGQIQIVPQGADPKDPPQTVEQLKLVSATGTGITKGEDGLFRVPKGGTLPSDPDARVTSGALEGSNVNVTQTLTDMIEASRAYETQVKMLNGAKEMDTSSTQLMNIDG